MAVSAATLTLRSVLSGHLDDVAIGFSHAHEYVVRRTYVCCPGLVLRPFDNMLTCCLEAQPSDGQINDEDADEILAP